MGKAMTGTIIDFDSVEGSWFTFFNSRVRDDGEIEYDEPAENAGRFCLRSMTPFIDEYYAGRKNESEFVFNKKTRAMERVTYAKDMSAAERKKFTDSMWDYVIVNWEGMLDKAGKAIPCTKENKVKLMTIPAIDRFVSKCLKVLSDDAVKQADELTTNL
jgi:hypothetical protein